MLKKRMQVQKKQYSYDRQKKTKMIVSIVRIILTIILSNSYIFLRCTNRTEKCKSPKD